MSGPKIVFGAPAPPAPPCLGGPAALPPAAVAPPPPPPAYLSAPGLGVESLATPPGLPCGGLTGGVLPDPPFVPQPPLPPPPDPPGPPSPVPPAGVPPTPPPPPPVDVIAVGKLIVESFPLPEQFEPKLPGE